MENVKSKSVMEGSVFILSIVSILKSLLKV